MEPKRNTISNGCCCGGCNDDHDQDGLRLPGFRFHPTDEELVGFYLKRKVEKRSLRGIDMIIKHMDIYKHDPWDLTNEGSNSSGVGDNNDNKEWYFYCKRGRKYRNSIRPNRVTGSGFWKATGIDKPIYSSFNNNNNNNNNANQQGNCIGLKKSLVYYRGSAGKGTKTDWMMHEFRLPNHYQHHYEPYLSNNYHSKEIAQEEAEIWTLCRIFKRNKKQNPDWRELSSKKSAMKSSSRTSSIDSNTNYYQHYITFAPANNDHTNNMINTIISDDLVTKAQNINNVIMGHQKNSHFQVDQNQQQWSFVARTPPSYSSSLNLVSENENDLQPLAYYGQNSWDDLNSVVEFAVNTPLIM